MLSDLSVIDLFANNLKRVACRIVRFAIQILLFYFIELYCVVIKHFFFEALMIKFDGENDLGGKVK